MIVFAALFATALAFEQSITVNIGASKDSAAAARARQHADSVERAREAGRASRDSAREARRRARVIPVTAGHLRTAFSDPLARATLERARIARVADDSALLGYDAKTHERASVGLSLARMGRERLLARYERVTRVQWRRDRGARVEMLAERTTSPSLGRGLKVDLNSVPTIPYFPGREPLWGSALARMDVVESDMVNPLARGAEAYYTYESGDSLSFRIGGETRISVRELRVRPRKPDWRVSVASLWFDDATGRLVRAVYRMSEPMDIWKVDEEDDGEGCDAPRVICAAMNPMTTTVSVVAIEYGLHEGRFWLPRLQTLDGAVRIGIARVPFKMEQSFTYNEVNGGSDFAAVVVTPADTATTDSAAVAARRAARSAPCESGESRERVVSRFQNTLAVSVRTPCDSLALARSPELPASPYDPGEEVFSSSELDELTNRALGMGAQAGFARGLPEFRYGLGMTRYNRIEGLSTGIAAKQSLGGGYTAHASVRLGLADLQPNAELSLQRSNGRTDIGVGIYRRLAAANDWGDPLAFGNSASALLFGRDEGFYYRTWGAELKRGPAEGARGILSRLFVEHHSDAEPEASFSLARALNGRRFGDNIDAANGTVGGLSLRYAGSRGLDPQGWRLLSDVRVEGAAGSFDYTRAAGDFTISRGLGARAAGALTVGGGTSGGNLPVQRSWFLGGAHTVRGQSPATRAGDSYWLARGEIGSSFVMARPVLFADFGWAGDRSDFSKPGTPISGAGVGASFLDGIVRFDLAKGIRPERGLRGYMYLEARF